VAGEQAVGEGVGGGEGEGEGAAVPAGADEGARAAGQGADEGEVVAGVGLDGGPRAAGGDEAGEVAGGEGAEALVDDRGGNGLGFAGFEVGCGPAAAGEDGAVCGGAEGDPAVLGGEGAGGRRAVQREGLGPDGPELVAEEGVEGGGGPAAREDEGVGVQGAVGGVGAHGGGLDGGAEDGEPAAEGGAGPEGVGPERGVEGVGVGPAPGGGGPGAAEPGAAGGVGGGGGADRDGGDAEGLEGREVGVDVRLFAAGERDGEGAGGGEGAGVGEGVQAGAREVDDGAGGVDADGGDEAVGVLDEAEGGEARVSPGRGGRGGRGVDEQDARPGVGEAGGEAEAGEAGPDDEDVGGGGGGHGRELSRQGRGAATCAMLRSPEAGVAAEPGTGTDAKPAAPTPLDRAGEPVADASRRVPLGGALSVEETPAAGPFSPAGEASARVPLGGAGSDAPGGGGAGAFAPSVAAAERVPLWPEAPAEAGAGGPFAPSVAAAERVPLWPEAPAEAGAGGPFAPSVAAADRVPLWPEAPADAGPAAEFAPSVAAADRVPLWPEAPADAGPAAEFAPSVAAADRVPLWPEAPADAGPAAEFAPSVAAADRVPLWPEAPPDAAPAADFTPSAARSDRVGRDPAADAPGGPPEAPPASPLAADRLRLDGALPAVLLPPSTLGLVGSDAVTVAGRHWPVAEPPRAVDGPSGLDGAVVLPPPGPRGPRPPAPAAPPAPPAARAPAGPRTLEVDSALADGQSTAPCGKAARVVELKSHRRLEFQFQRYEIWTVRRRYLGCDAHPGVRVREDLPAFVSPRVPVGNGWLAQLVVARYADGSSLDAESRLAGELGFGVAAPRLAEALTLAHAAVEPVFAAHAAAVRASAAIDEDLERVLVHRPGVRGGDEVRVWAAASAAGHLLLPTTAGPDPLDGSPARRKVEGARARAWALDRAAQSRLGRWAQVRLRLLAALPVAPQEAGYGLHLALGVRQAWTSTPDLPRLTEAADRFFRWLDAAPARSPALDAFDRALAYAHSVRADLVPVLGRGLAPPLALPEGAPAPSFVAPADEGGLDALCTWVSLIESCHARGVRPWEYLHDLFDALARGAVGDPARWAPAVWPGPGRLAP